MDTSAAIYMIQMIGQPRLAAFGFYSAAMELFAQGIRNGAFCYESQCIKHTKKLSVSKLAPTP